MLARSCVETSRAFGLAYISLHHFFYLRLRGAKRLSITNVTKVKLGSGDDTVVRVFIVLLPLQPGVDSWTCWRHMWVEFIFGPRPCYEGFLPSQKTKTPHSNSTWKQWTRRATSWNVNHQILFVLIITIFIMIMIMIIIGYYLHLYIFTFLCISRTQTMHRGHQSLKSIILFIHQAPFWGLVQIPACRSFESL